MRIFLAYNKQYMKVFTTIGLLVLSNAFMNVAWYGHLKFFAKSEGNTAWWLIILVSWGLAFFEYCFQVPANRIGFEQNGGPFSLVQLKVLQEVITLVIFMLFSVIAFKNIHFTSNHFIGFVFLVLAVYFIFKK
ncbi:DMT family protein [Olivibacter jilunii]